MPGHLFKITELNGDQYMIVTKQNSEDAAREEFRKVFGSSANVYKVEYVSFVHHCQS
ncbi:MAG TPA: hypothetical protein VI423_02975 [Paenisporosarcina sp.]|nr:hypothetical protein [Paenisporosarcina sp.]